MKFYRKAQVSSKKNKVLYVLPKGPQYYDDKTTQMKISISSNHQIIRFRLKSMCNHHPCNLYPNKYVHPKHFIKVSKGEIMGILVSKEAPLFKTAAVMPNKTFGEISLSDYRNKNYVVLFFYPLDFTFVCPTELLAFSQIANEFEKLDVQLLACSVDSKYTHFAWLNIPREQGGLGGLNYPLLSDLDKSISSAYHVLLPEQGVALRGLFLIDKKGIVQHELVNNLPLGRDVYETLRIVQALQFIENNGEVCPANWHKGEPGLKEK